MRGEWLTGLKVHFQCAHETLAIARENALGRCPVHPLDHAPEEFDTPALPDSIQPASECLVFTRPWEQASCKRAIVKTRTADEDRDLASRVDLRDCGHGIACKVRRRVFLCRIDN